MQSFEIEDFLTEPVSDLTARTDRSEGSSSTISCSYPHQLRPVIGQHERMVLERIAPPLLSAIDRMVDGEPDAEPSEILRYLTADELGLLLDLFSREPSLQHVLANPELSASAKTSLRWAVIGDVIDSILV